MFSRAWVENVSEKESSYSGSMTAAMLCSLAWYGLEAAARLVAAFLHLPSLTFHLQRGAPHSSGDGMEGHMDRRVLLMAGAI